jgi:DNA end-binding protein Ku
VLHNMLWPDEIRDPAFEFLDQRTQVRKQELEMARSLVDSMAGDFDPDQFDDDYRDAMRQLIEAKAEGAELPKRPEPKREEAVDLMTALQQSVEAAKSSHRGSATKSGSTKPASPKSASPKSGSTKSASPKSASPKSGSTKSASPKSGSSRRKRGNSNKRSA